jgi:hypothetical protein
MRDLQVILLKDKKKKCTIQELLVLGVVGDKNISQNLSLPTHTIFYKRIRNI